MSAFLLGAKSATHPLTVYFHILILGCYALTQDCSKIEVKGEEFWRLSCTQREEGTVQERGKEAHNCWWDNEERISNFYYKSLTCYLLTDYEFVLNTSVRHSAVSAAQIIYLCLPLIKKNRKWQTWKFLAPGRSGGYIVYGGIGYSWVLSLETASCHGLTTRVLKWLLVFGNILRTWCSLYLIQYR